MDFYHCENPAGDVLGAKPKSGSLIPLGTQMFVIDVKQVV